MKKFFVLAMTFILVTSVYARGPHHDRPHHHYESRCLHSEDWTRLGVHALTAIAAAAVSPAPVVVNTVPDTVVTSSTVYSTPVVVNRPVIVTPPPPPPPPKDFRFGPKPPHGPRHPQPPPPRHGGPHGPRHFR